MNIYFLSLLIFFLLFVFCKTEVNSLVEFSVQKRNHETLYSLWWFNCTQLVGVPGAALLLGVVRCIHTSLNWNEPWWSWCMRDLFKIRWKSIGNMTEWLFQSSFLLSAEQYCVIDRQLELEMCGHQSCLKCKTWPGPLGKWVTNAFVGCSSNVACPRVEWYTGICFLIFFLWTVR